MTHLETFTNEYSSTTPLISLEQGIIFIMGRSIPKDPVNFYAPLQEWTDNYCKNYSGKTQIIIGFDHISTASVKVIYNILRDFTEDTDIENTTSVKWYYERADDDLSELGKIFESLFPTNFRMIEVENIDKDFCKMVLKSKKNPINSI